jgi:hypothetical protein
MRTLALLFLVPLVLMSAEKISVEVEREPQGKHHFFVLRGLSSDQEKTVEVKLILLPNDRKQIEQQPALAGELVKQKDQLRYVPKYPPIPGFSYRLSYRFSPREAFESVDLAIPKPKRTPTEVATVYPTGNLLPENQLKFYLYFSASMSRGDAYDHLQLLDGNGKPIDKAFLELGEELWDAEQKRFTLLFDPGRIKRGLKPREDLGPVLEEGKSFTLVISEKWQDAHGDPLKSAFKKSFKVGPPDEKQPNQKDWKVSAPTKGSDPVRLKFPEPLDHALLDRMLWVVDANGKTIPGETTVSEEETAWAYLPANEWKPGRYQIVIDKRLEDRAGNSLAKPFEVDETDVTRSKIEIETVQIPFEVK